MSDTQSLHDEIDFLKKQLDACADGITEQKFLQQAKKVRELSVKLDSEKARVAKLQAAIIKNEREQHEIQEAQRKGVLLPSAAGRPSAAEMEAAHTAAQVADLRQKLDKSASQCASLRAACDKHDKDMRKVRQILVAEIGDEGTVEKLLSSVDGGGGAAAATSSSNNTRSASPSAASVTTAGGGGGTTSTAGYRARAQQISLLQAKVKDLNRKLIESANITSSGQSDISNNNNVNNSALDSSSEVGGVAPSSIGGRTTTVKDFDSAHRSAVTQAGNRRLVEAQKQAAALDEAREQLQSEKQRADAMSSRVHTLEKQTLHLRTSLQQVIQKTQNDDELVEAYKAEIDTQRAEIRALHKNTLGNGAPLSARGGGGSGGFASDNNGSAENYTLRISQLETEVNTLRRQLSNSAAAANSSSSSSSAVAKQQQSAKDVSVVEAQRKMIINLEQRLQNVEAMASGGLSAFTKQYGTGTNTAVVQALRDENASLKERIGALTNMVDREIELRRAQLMATQQQNEHLASAVAQRSPHAVRGSAIAVGGEGKNQRSNNNNNNSNNNKPPPARRHEVDDEDEDEPRTYEHHQQQQQDSDHDNYDSGDRVVHHATSSATSNVKSSEGRSSRPAMPQQGVPLSLQGI